MSMCKVVGAALSAFVLGATGARAAVIDFEAFPAGPFVSHSEAGVTFSAFGGTGMILATIGPNGTKGLLDSNEPRKRLRADIAGDASFVAVDLGDFDADADTLFLEIFDAADVSLGFTSILIDASFTGMKTLSLSAPDIAYAVFGATAPAVNGSSVYADNFTWTPEAAVIPEPATLGTLGAGLAWVLARRRRSR